MADNLFDVLSSEENIESDTPNVNTNSPAEEDLSFFDIAEQSPEEEVSVGYWTSVLNAVPKGLIKGTIALGRAMGPLPEGEDQHYDPEQISAFLEEKFPTDEGYLSGAVERAGKIAPLVLSSPSGSSGVGSQLIRTGAAATLGEGVKQAGGPEWLQSIAEIVPFLAPDLSKMNSAGSSKEKILNFVKERVPKAISKKIDSMISADKSKGEILAFARKMEMTEEEITPLLQGETKKKWLSKLATKGESTQKSLKQTKSGIGRVFDSIKESLEATAVLTEEQGTRLVKELQDKFADMPASVRNLVKEDFQIFASKAEKTGKDAIDLYQKINHEIGKNTLQLGTTHGPIKKMLSEIDPNLGDSFDMTNKLYSKYVDIAKRLKPEDADKWVSRGKVAAALYGVVTGNIGVLIPLAGYEGSKKVAEKMLTSPRLQGLASKMVSAVNQGLWVVAEHIKSQIIDEVKDADPKISKAIEETKIEDIFKN